MPRFSANLSMLFTEVPLVERFGRAARAGFRAVEVQFPYELPAATIRDELVSHRLELVLHNLPAGDWAAGDRGIAADPARVAEFRHGVARAVEYARTLQTPRLNCLAGKLPAGVSATVARQTLVDNLRFAAAALEEAGLTLLIEPVNRFDVPGFLVQRTDDAIAIIDEVGAPNLKLQYDIYHQQRTEGELAATIERLLPRIGHLQVADNPGRHEPGTGEIAMDFLFAHIDRLGYSGHIGCEYKPAAGTEQGLNWMRRWQ
jgi:hydroxypyruvate isomerase